MPRDSSGVYTRADGPYVNGTVADADEINNELDDLGDEITASLEASGKKTWTGTQNANGFGIKTLANTRVFTLSGGTTAYTLSTGASFTSYTQIPLIFVKPNVTNTGSATLNVDSIGALTIKKHGSTNLAAGDFVQDRIYALAYDGTNLQLIAGDLSTLYQPLDATLTALAALAWTSGNQFPYFTAADTLSLGPITAAGLALVDDADAAAQRTTLGLGTAAVKNTGTSGDAVPLLNASNTHSGSNTFSGVVTHTGDVIETSADMTHDWRETGVAANEGNWRLAVNASAWTLYTANDALNSFTPFLAFSRSGQTPTAATFGGVVLVPAGSASAPAVAGSGDTNTGIYFPGSDVLGIATGGTVRWTVTAAGALVSQNSSKIYTADGSVGSPGFNFVDDQDNGLYRIGTNNWGLSAGGAKIVDIATTGIVVTGTIKGRTETSSEASGTLTSASANTVVKATGGITINDGVFTAGDHIEVYNDSDSSITITQDTGMTLRLAGTTSTGNRTLAARGIAIIYFDTNADATVGGTGVS